MSQRPGFVVDHQVPADGGVSPNAYVPVISVQVRCNWPPRATYEQVIEALGAAMGKAMAELANGRERWRRDEPTHRYDWAEPRDQ